MKRFWVLSSALVLVASLGVGCGKKGDKGKEGGGTPFNCDTIVKKNRECSAELADALVGDMKLSDEMKKKLGDKMKEAFTSDKFKERCKKGWDSDKKRDKEMKAVLKKCFGKKDCKAFASCFAESMKKRRGMRPGGMR